MAGIEVTADEDSRLQLTGEGPHLSPQQSWDTHDPLRCNVSQKPQYRVSALTSAHRGNLGAVRMCAWRVRAKCCQARAGRLSPHGRHRLHKPIAWAVLARDDALNSLPLSMAENTEPVESRSNFCLLRL
jgi:hypothetical protein